MIQESTVKLWKGGTDTLVLTVPKNVVIIQDLKKGDYVKVTIEKIEKINKGIKVIK